MPYAEADYSTGVGNAKVFLDAVGWTASRETAHAGSTVTGVDFPLTGYAGGTSSDIAPLGRAASAGGTGKLADAGHVHDAGIIAIQSKSASFTLATTDSNVHIDTTGGVVQITLYAPGGVPREHFLKHIAGANKITVLHGSVNVEAPLLTSISLVRASRPRLHAPSVAALQRRHELRDRLTARHGRESR